jgi:hypothetical protein
MSGSVSSRVEVRGAEPAVRFATSDDVPAPSAPPRVHEARALAPNVTFFFAIEDVFRALERGELDAADLDLDRELADRGRRLRTLSHTPRFRPGQVRACRRRRASTNTTITKITKNLRVGCLRHH